eukprot:jgi/Mesvir1/18487/Mv14332-RA.1
MAKTKRPASKARACLPKVAKKPNTDGKPKVPRYTAADIGPSFQKSRGEVPASIAEVKKARGVLDEWFKETVSSINRIVQEQIETLDVARARFLRHGVPNLMRHLEAHAEYVHSKCKEMAAEYGRGALLFRVDRLANANQSVVLDWVTDEEMKKLDYEVSWSVRSHNQDKEFAAVFLFRHFGRTDKRLFVSRIFDVAKCLKASAGANVPSRSWVRLDRDDQPFAPLCIGHHCNAKMVKGADVRVCGRCDDAMFCSAVCGVASHECRKVAGLRQAMNKATLVDRLGEDGAVPVRCPHRWNVSMDATLSVL